MLVVLFWLTFWLLTQNGWANGPLVSLDLEVEGTQVTATWELNFIPQSLTLYYAPWPEMFPIGEIALPPDQDRLTVSLPYGAAFYVAVGAVDEEGYFHLSNIEYFRLRPIWRPQPGTTWQWQLTEPLDLSVEAEMFDVDLFLVSQEEIEALHRQGRIVICYFSAGTFEPWRPDADSFPEEVIGKALEDWPDERWLDIRRLDLLAPIMEARLDLAVRKGCDGVEPDNVDGYQNDTGFPLSYEDQLRYNIFLARKAHQRGLSVGLKNDLDQIPSLLSYFDWALNEECFSYQECDKLLPFVQAGKAVFGVEYELEPEEFCPEANALGFSFMKKHWDLDAWRIACWDFE